MLNNNKYDVLVIIYIKTKIFDLFSFQSFSTFSHNHKTDVTHENITRTTNYTKNKNKNELMISCDCIYLYS